MVSWDGLLPLLGRLTFCLDGVVVARVGRHQTVLLHGSGEVQRLEAWMSWTTGAPLEVQDRDDATVHVSIRMRPLLSASWRSLFSPSSVWLLQHRPG